jgi:hypothetical protein
MVIAGIVSAAASAMALSAASLSGSSTTETYVYDVRGRLVDVQRTGGLLDGIRSRYEYDAADNRTRRWVTGA